MVILLVGLSRRALKMMVQPSTPKLLLRRLHSVSDAMSGRTSATIFAPSTPSWFLDKLERKAQDNTTQRCKNIKNKSGLKKKGAQDTTLRQNLHEFAQQKRITHSMEESLSKHVKTLHSALVSGGPHCRLLTSIVSTEDAIVSKKSL